MEPFSIIAPTASADGYGYSAEALVMSAVNDHGADVWFIEHDWRDSRFSDPEFTKLRVPPHLYSERDILVVYFLPFALTRFRSRLTIGMSMWETDRLPDSWAACGSYANGFIVPSESSAQTFREGFGRAGINMPVESVPFGTDTNLYEYCDRASVHPHQDLCVFLMAGMLHYRKGLEFALRALREEFSVNEPVQLILKTRKGFLDAGSEHAMLDDPRVQIIDEDFNRVQMVTLYHTVDCLLAPSRGEGSGLTPRDAMATGLPVILTNWSGLAELADERYNYPIPVEDLEPAPHDCTSYAPGITGAGPIGNFARPSVPALRAAMRQVYENREEARGRGGEAAGWMRRQWTWERCAYKWLQALEKLTTLYVAVN